MPLVMPGRRIGLVKETKVAGAACLARTSSWRSGLWSSAIGTVAHQPIRAANTDTGPRAIDMADSWLRFRPRTPASD